MVLVEWLLLAESVKRGRIFIHCHKDKDPRFPFSLMRFRSNTQTHSPTLVDMFHDPDGGTFVGGDYVWLLGKLCLSLSFDLTAARGILMILMNCVY